MLDGSDMAKLLDAEEAIKEMLSDPSINGKAVLFLVNKSVGDCQKDLASFNFLPFNDLVMKCTKDLDLNVYVEEACCLGFFDWKVIAKYLELD